MMAPAGYYSVSLKESVSVTGHLESGGEAEARGKHRTHRILIIVLALLSFVLFITVIVLAVQRRDHSSAGPSPGPCPPVGSACPDGWVGYRGKCYYFSETEKDWASSQQNCFALGASLAEIDTQQDMDFMVRYKGHFDHWIGLQRDPGKPWKWASGTEFSNWFQIRGDGDCAYLDSSGVGSLRCTAVRHSICTKADVFT